MLSFEEYLIEVIKRNEESKIEIARPENVNSTVMEASYVEITILSHDEDAFTS
jgi:hypothetical protein